MTVLHPSALRWPARSRPARADLVLVLLVIPVVLGLSFVIAQAPLLALVAALAVAVGTVIFFRPAVAAYVMIGVTPLVVGIDRGRILPVLRPNEALLVLCAAALMTRAVWNLRTGTRLRPRLGLVAWSLLLMAVFNSVVPLTAMAVRGVPISADDLSYAAVLWKYLALYAVVRASVRTETELRRCLWVAMTAAAIVSVVAILQSLQLFGVPQLLNAFYAPYGDSTLLSNNRGSSTLALAAATGDLLIFNVALVAGFWRRFGFRPRVLAPIAGLFVIGTLASGQFSAAIGLALAMIAIGFVSRRAGPPVLLGLIGAGATLVLWPVIAQRLSGFDSVSGLPESWVGRLYNLRNYFWPRLFSDYNFVLGVQPSARVPSPSSLALPWVWIESGYTWLLWGGGIPLFLAFVLFVAAALCRSWHVARRTDTGGVVGDAVFISVLVVTVLMLFDPHITYRGSSDLLFCLLALMAIVEARTRQEDVEIRGMPTAVPQRTKGSERPTARRSEGVSHS